MQEDWGWGIVVSVLRKPPKANAAVNGGAAIANAAAAAAAAAGDGDDIDVKAVAANAASCYIVDTLLPCKAGTVAAGVARPQPIGIGSAPTANGNAAAAAAAGGGAKAEDDAAADGASSAELTVMPVLLPLVTSLSSLRVTLPDDIRPAEVRQSLLCVLQVGGVRGPGGEHMWIHHRSVAAAVAVLTLALQHTPDGGSHACLSATSTGFGATQPTPAPIFQHPVPLYHISSFLKSLDCCVGCLQDIAKRYPDGIPLLDPVNDMGINDPAVVAAIQNMNDLEQQLAKNPGASWSASLCCTTWLVA